MNLKCPLTFSPTTCQLVEQANLEMEKISFCIPYSKEVYLFHYEIKKFLFDNFEIAWKVKYQISKVFSYLSDNEIFLLII